MTPTECVDVVEFLAARCPAMRMHEQTPDAWYIDLAPHTRDDAIEAARRRSRTQTFVSLAELLDELDTIERTRTGRQRLHQLEQQITAENPPAELRAVPVAALTVGQAVTGAGVLMRREVAARRRAETDADVAARTRDAERREQARLELEAVRATRPDADVGGECAMSERTLDG